MSPQFMHSTRPMHKAMIADFIFPPLKLIKRKPWIPGSKILTGDYIAPIGASGRFKGLCAEGGRNERYGISNPQYPHCELLVAYCVSISYSRALDNSVRRLDVVGHRRPSRLCSDCRSNR